jgi:hypothetical protein
MGVLEMRVLFGAGAVLAATLVLAVPAAEAHQPLGGSGTLHLFPPSALLFSEPLGQDTLATESGTLAFTGGTIVGSGTITVTAVVSATGEKLVATWSAPATVSGRSGTLRFLFAGTDNGQYNVSFLLYGSGGLAGLTGSGTASGQDASGLGTYTLTYTG